MEGKGTVAGALYYFPIENERETVPTEPVQSAADGPASMALTQHPVSTQLALTQARQGSPELEGKQLAS